MIILYIWPPELIQKVHEDPLKVVSVTYKYVGLNAYFNFFANFAYFYLLRLKTDYPNLNLVGFNRDLNKVFERFLSMDLC